MKGESSAFGSGRSFRLSRKRAARSRSSSPALAVRRALVELAAAGGYAAIRHGADLRGTIVSAAIALVLGIALVLLKALLH